VRLRVAVTAAVILAASLSACKGVSPGYSNPPGHAPTSGAPIPLLPYPHPTAPGTAAPIPMLPYPHGTAKGTWAPPITLIPLPPRSTRSAAPIPLATPAATTPAPTPTPAPVPAASPNR